MTLDGLDSGRQARITGVDWAVLAEDEGKRLKALGVDEGAQIEIVHRGIFGTRDPLAVRLGNMTIAVRRTHAAAIRVEAA